MAGNISPITPTSARTAASTKTGSDSGNARPGVGDETGRFAPLGGERLPVPGHKVELSDAIEKLNEAMRDGGRQLRFHIDESSGRTIIFVVNSADGEIVRQIPSEEAVALARNIGAAGLLIDAEA